MYPLNTVYDSNMLVLAVDTSRPRGSVAVLDDENVLGISSIPPDAPLSASLFTQLAVLLKETGLAMARFDLFAVCAGPGSFTGLRVGLTAAKAWSEVFQRPIAAISGLQAIAAKSQCRSTFLAPFFSAGRGQVFAALYTQSQASFHRIGDELVLSPQDFATFICANATASDLTLVSTTASALDEALGESVLKGARVQAVSEPLADTIGILGYRQAMLGHVMDAYTLDANYVRRCDAELSWVDPVSKSQP